MSETEQGGAGRREVAYRVFAAEYDDADYSYSESDEERAPNYVITPTGARVNRLFAVGVLTEVEQVSDDVLRARVVDPTGAFVLYAGQYQPDEQAVLEQVEPPAFVAVTGKARTFQPEDSTQVFTSIRPESINEVDAETRDRWTLQAAEQTLSRVGWLAAALERAPDERADWLAQQDIDDGLAAGIPLAIDHYGTTPTYLDALREMALDAARVVADELDEVEPPEVAPDASGDVRAADLARSTTDVLSTEISSDDTTASAVVDESPSESAASESETVRTDVESAVEETETATADVEPAESGSDVSADTEPASQESEVARGEPETEGSETGESATGEPAHAETGAGATDVELTASEPTDSEPTGSDPIDSGSTDAEPTDSPAETSGPGDFDPDEFELDPETREQVEEEYGTEFQSGTEVDEPGSADIETPDPEPADADQSDAATDEEYGSSGVSADETPAVDAESVSKSSETSEAAESESSETSEEAEPEPSEATGDDEPSDASDEQPTEWSEDTEPEDVQAAVLSVMRDLDDGDGADREALVTTMEQRHGTSSSAVEEAIQEALMDGQCYEPDDDTLKPI